MRLIYDHVAISHHSGHDDRLDAAHSGEATEMTWEARTPDANQAGGHMQPLFGEILAINHQLRHTSRHRSLLAPESAHVRQCGSP